MKVDLERLSAEIHSKLEELEVQKDSLLDQAKHVERIREFCSTNSVAAPAIESSSLGKTTKSTSSDSEANAGWFQQKTAKKAAQN
jgi:hypothetical protein